MLIGPPDMSATVQRFSMGGVSLRTYAPSSTTADGMIASGGFVDAPITAHVFPALGEDIARLELQSPSNVVEIHDPVLGRLSAVTKGSQARASVVVWNSKTYEVKALGEWWGGPLGTKGYQQAWAQEVVRA